MAWMVPAAMLATTAAGIWANSKHGKKVLGGNDEIKENVSTLRPDQEALSKQAVQAGMNPGRGVRLEIPPTITEI